MAPVSNELILLGLEDSAIPATVDDKCSPQVSKIGGVANWPPVVASSLLPRSSPVDSGVGPDNIGAELGPLGREVLLCSECGCRRALIAQVYAPIGHSPYHRTLYVLACVDASCAETGVGWSCWRVQFGATGASDSNCAPTDDTDQRMARRCTADWIDGADDWSDADDVTDDVGGESLRHAVASVNLHSTQSRDSPSETAPVQPALPMSGLTTRRAFAPCYLTVIEEPVESAPAAAVPCQTGRCEDSDDSAGQLWREQYESAAPAHGDTLLYKMQSRLARCRHQLLRYCRDSSECPLLLQPLPAAAAAGRCRHCGGRLVLELQLMPTLVARLRPVATAGGAVPEFGTVLVFCCADSCWCDQAPAVRREHVLVQTES